MTRPVKMAAGIIPVRRDDDGWRVLVLRAFRHWDFPKGLLDPGEDALAAALREAREEADLDDLALPWGTQEHCDTEPYAGGKVARYFLALTRRRDVVLPVSAELGRPEHDEGRWVSFDEAAALLPPRLQPVLAWARERVSTTPGP
jgi:8-oxo-dGTP pyrophosphatase MutT (NUDIX family)